MSKRLEQVERERDWMHGRLEECREQVAELRAYAEELAGLLSCAVLYVGSTSDPQDLAVQRLREDIKGALAENPNPAGLLSGEASGSQATEASGAGRAGTELTGAQALGDSAGADPAFTGSPAVGTKASSGATNPTVGNCHETNSDLAGALSDLLRQVEAFTEENGEADFFTGRARAALRHQSNSESERTLSDFIRNATPTEKQEVYEKVIDRSIERQQFQVGGWISVTERLPELHAIVLGTGFNYGDPDRGRWTCVLCRASERHDFGWEATGIGGHEPPTHWMPLPAAPDSCHVAGKKPNDTERLDFLECELGTEKRHPGYVSVFRRNLPVDRIAIDQAMRWVRQREEFAIGNKS